MNFNFLFFKLKLEFIWHALRMLLRFILRKQRGQLGDLTLQTGLLFGNLAHQRL